MGTKDFNILDKFIAWARLRKVAGYVEKGDRLLDFGCGHQAYLLHQVQDKIKTGVGLDYDSSSYEISPKAKVMHFHFTESLPFQNNSFDKIIILAVLEHFTPETASKLFDEFHRVLSPGGMIVLTTPTPWGQKILEFLAFRLHIISEEEVADHKKYYSKGDLFGFAKKHSYIIEKYNTFQLGGNSICVMKKERN